MNKWIVSQDGKVYYSTDKKDKAKTWAEQNLDQYNLMKTGTELEDMVFNGKY